MTQNTVSPKLMPSQEVRNKRRKLRNFYDKASQFGITGAGIAVVFSLGMIFFYLFSEVAPLFKSASVQVTKSSQFVNPDEVQPIHITLDRYEEIAGVFKSDGNVRFEDLTQPGSFIDVTPAHPEASKITATAKSITASDMLAYGYDSGRVLIVKPSYAISYPNDKRKVTPSLGFPLGDEALAVKNAAGDTLDSPIVQLAVQEINQGMGIVAQTESAFVYNKVTVRTNPITGLTQTNQQAFDLPELPAGHQIRALQLDETGRHLVVASQNALFLMELKNPKNPQLIKAHKFEGDEIRQMKFLVGTGSVIVGNQSGNLSQWFIVRDQNNNFNLKLVREFKGQAAAITTITPEYHRRGFWVGDEKGNVGIYFATSERTLLQDNFSKAPITELAVSPIYGKALIMDASGVLQEADVWNRHPEISFKSLWTKVWYEGRDAPDYIWQASSASDTFEAKMSFVPLAIGTLKAAFFAVLFAVPIGVMGAIYTAYFMTPKLRGMIKPTIEIMAALPTVILGFLAGLWLAPFIENHLPAVFSIFIVIPLTMLVTGYAWSRCPQSWRDQISEGWEAMILIVPIVLVVWLCVSMSTHVEVAFFDGSMRQWFTDNGISYDQRNALVVGIVMGFAIIPSIFSIAEDAVFSVPRHLTQGSLALGATPWQTMVGVILPTASPGIFSAVMMGFGRAVGETMIVLMATGNSPVTNFNIFEGMRTFSANIAVELPETAVASTHYRVLFLAALVLLAFTFVVNTLAETIRQRLRARYSNL